MNAFIKNLAAQHKMYERFSRYGESTEEDYYEFYPDELDEFVSAIIVECCRWVDGVPTGDDGAILLSKQFVIANIKNHFGVKE